MTDDDAVGRLADLVRDLAPHLPPWRVVDVTEHFTSEVLDPLNASWGTRFSCASLGCGRHKQPSGELTTVSEGHLYLLHFSEPLGDASRPRMSASHYLGWADDLERRLQVHMRGRGPNITAAAVARGITLELAWTEPGDRNRERRLKNNGHYERRCRICKADRADS